MEVTIRCRVELQLDKLKNIKYLVSWGDDGGRSWSGEVVLVNSRIKQSNLKKLRQVYE